MASLATTIAHHDSCICAAIIMPDDVAEEKSKALGALGAKVEKVRPSSIVDKKQFVVRECFNGESREICTHPHT